MRTMFRRQAVPTPAQIQSKTKVFPAPVRGWVTNENLATGGKNAASTLVNIFPTPTGARLRKGSFKVGTTATNKIVSMFSYKGKTGEKLFVSDDTKIYDAFAGLSTSVSGQTNGDYYTASFSTPGADFLYAVNGTNKAQLYNGTAWQQVTAVSTPIAITGVDTANLSHVWSYKSRLFFVEKNSKTAWFLPIDVVGGAAQDIALGGIFQKGGSLLFGATWSIDSGNGVDDKCVFVSTEGEVVIYQGSDPSDPNDWKMVGLYDITRPLGPKAIMKAGGDLLIATVVGIVPLSQATQKDVAALSLASVSKPIEPDWVNEAATRFLGTWSILKWPERKMAIVGMPMDGEAKPYCFVVNLETGAWTKYTGWDFHASAIYQNKAYFGTEDGRILEAEAGATDDGASYYCDYVGLFDHMGAPTANKTLSLARATFKAAVPLSIQITATTDYGDVIPVYPALTSDAVPSSAWDTGLWDVAVWDGGAAKRVTTRWLGVYGSGFVIAPALRVLVNGGAAPDGELISLDYLYTVNGTVV